MTDDQIPLLLRAAADRLPPTPAPTDAIRSLIRRRRRARLLPPVAASLAVAVLVPTVLVSSRSSSHSVRVAPATVRSSAPVTPPGRDARDAKFGDGVCTASLSHYGYDLAPPLPTDAVDFARHSQQDAVRAFTNQLPADVANSSSIERGAYEALVTSRIPTGSIRGLTRTPVWVVEQSGLDQGFGGKGGQTVAPPIFQHSAALVDARTLRVLLTQLCS